MTRSRATGTQQKQQPAPVSTWPDGGLGTAVGYYALMGLFGAALATWFVFSLATQILAGQCSSFGLLCDRSLQEFIAPGVAGVVGGTLLPTAFRLRRTPPMFGPIVGAGVVVGVAIAVLPIILTDIESRRLVAPLR